MSALERQKYLCRGISNTHTTFADDFKDEAAVRLMNKPNVYTSNVPLAIVGGTVRFIYIIYK